MKTLTKLPVVALAMTCASPAMADITVDQAYDQIMKMMQVNPGTTPTVGSVVRSGSTLVASDVAMSLSEPDFNLETSIDSITFTDQGDGTVLVQYSEVMPITVSGDSGDDAFKLEFELIQKDTTYVLSGTPENTTYDYTAPSTIFAIKTVESPDDDLDVSGQMTLTGGSGTYTTTTDTLMTIDMDFGFEKTVLDLNIMEKSAGEGAVIAFEMAGLGAKGSVAFPEDQSKIDPENPFASGLAIDIGYGYDSVNYDFDINADGEQINAQVTTGAGDLMLVLNQDQMAYGSNLNDLDFTVSVPSSLPFPVQASAKQLGFNMKMPVGKNVAGDFELSTNLREISIDDGILNMVDPGQVMPRDPVTLAFGLTGRAMWYYNLFDPEEAAEMERADVPGEIYDVTLSDLDISAVGAALTGSGAFTFDNDDFMTIPGMPRPEGKLELNMVGANGLIDRLIQMGIIEQGDAMGARMMMGLFATPGAGEDTLTSTIEVNEAGHVSANGQRLR